MLAFSNKDLTKLSMQQVLLGPVEMHNLLISKDILVRCNVTYPALNHQFHDPVTISQH